MNAPTDFLGHEIKAGDVIVYPVRRGSKMWLNKLRVTQVLPESVKGLNPEGRWVTVQNMENVVVVTHTGVPAVATAGPSNEALAS